MAQRKVTPVPAPEDCELLDDDVVAADLRITTGTLANWRCKRKGPPFVKVGNRAKYPKGDYLRWKAFLPRLGGQAA